MGTAYVLEEVRSRMPFAPCSLCNDAVYVLGFSRRALDFFLPLQNIDQDKSDAYGGIKESFLFSMPSVGRIRW